MIQIHNVDQRTEEWYELRKKYPLTASKAQAIASQGKGLETLVWQKLSEIYSSATDKESYTNENLDRGTELEPQAREIYELETGNKVSIVGFVTDESISKVGGASPDGLVNEDGNLEIKCFEDIKHFKIICDIENFDIESQYLWQMQMQMLFTGRKWCDFVAYNPNYSKSLIIKRVYEDKIMQEKIITGLVIGEKLINEIELKLKKNGNK